MNEISSPETLNAPTRGLDDCHVTHCTNEFFDNFFSKKLLRILWNVTLNTRKLSLSHTRTHRVCTAGRLAGD